MIKYFTFSVLLFFTASCNQTAPVKEPSDKSEQHTVTRFYSKEVKDSFSIFVNLPNDYDPQKEERYPVVYLLDANLYFDIMAVTINKYAEVGLAPDIILVGIGYKDFPAMDSLRNRDDTYPVAIPEYEMSVSGGADQFLSFIDKELIPHIDKVYKTDTSKKVLMGHSLGGYFTTYALLQNLAGKNNSFSSYIAASPSVHYNKYYLLNQLKEIPAQKERSRKLRTYITFGGLEDSNDTEDSSMLKLSEVSGQLLKLLSAKQSGCVIYKSDTYSNLSHMDTQIPTFIKGLQWALSKD
jgi:uncharacterized protein